MKHLLYIFLCLIPQYCFSQNEPSSTELLTRLSVAQDDITKTELLNTLAFLSFTKGEADEGIRFAKQALSLAEQLKLNKAITEASNCIGLCYDLKSESKIAQGYLVDHIDTINVYENPTFYSKSVVWVINFYRQNKNYEECLAYATYLLAFRKKKKLLEEAYGTARFIGDTFVEKKDTTNALKYWSEAVKLSTTVNEGLVDLLNNIGLIYYTRDKNADSAIFYFNKGLAASLKMNDGYRQGMSLLYLARAYQLIRNSNAIAIKHFASALIGFEKIRDENKVALTLNNMASAYLSAGDNARSLQHYLASLKLSEKLGYDELTATNYNDISNVLKAERQYDKALEYLLLAKQKFQAQGKNVFLPAVAANIATIYALMNDTAKSMKYIKQSLDLADTLAKADKNYVVSKALNTLSAIYSGSNDYKRALATLNEALQLNKDENDSAAQALNTMHLGKIYLSMATEPDKATWPDSLQKLSAKKLAERAINYLTSSLIFYEKKGLLPLLHENYRLLAEAKKMHGDFGEAYQYLQQYIVYRDSVINIDAAKKIEELKYGYELEKNKVQARDTLRTWIIAGAAITCTVVLLLLFYRTIEHNKFNNRMAELRQNALNAQMSDHFISNTMDSINSFIQNNDKEKASEYLSLFSRLVRKVLENAAEKTILLTEELEVLTAYIELEKLRFTQGKGLQYEIDVEDTIEPHRTIVPPMIFQVLVENAIKHGLTKKESGKLLIKIRKNRNTIECTVQDDGVGRFASRTQKGINGENRKSFGSSLAEKLAKSVSHNDKIASFTIIDLVDEGKQPAGTAVQFTLPHIIDD